MYYISIYENEISIPIMNCILSSILANLIMACWAKTCCWADIE